MVYVVCVLTVPPPSLPSPGHGFMCDDDTVCTCTQSKGGHSTALGAPSLRCVLGELCGDISS